MTQSLAKMNATMAVRILFNKLGPFISLLLEEDLKEEIARAIHPQTVGVSELGNVKRRVSELHKQVKELAIDKTIEGAAHYYTLSALVSYLDLAWAIALNAFSVTLDLKVAIADSKVEDLENMFGHLLEKKK